MADSGGPTRKDMLIVVQALSEAFDRVSKQVEVIGKMSEESHRAVFGDAMSEGLSKRIKTLEDLVCGTDGVPGLAEQIRRLAQTVQSAEKVGWLILSTLIVAVLTGLLNLVLR